MQIPDEIRRCVCFIGFRDKNGKEIYGGSGFFFDLVRSDGSIFHSIVTVKHNIENLQRAGQKTLLVRFTTTEGKTDLAETDIGAWLFHPTDPYVDVAVLPLPEAIWSFYGFSSDLALTQKLIESEPVGPGDEVFFPGLFRQHYGTEKHIPIVRAGNIAAMAEEQVRIDWFGTKVSIDAFLIEARSIGGLSGSPAFAYVGMHRFRQRVAEDGTVKRKVVTKPNRFYFMGLVHGHYEEPGEPERINSGIAIVVPVSAVMEVVEHAAETGTCAG